MSYTYCQKCGTHYKGLVYFDADKHECINGT